MGSTEKARKIAEIIKVKDSIRIYRDTFVENFKVMAKGAPPNEVREVITKLDEIFASHYEAGKQIVVGAYVRAFSDAELDAMIEFYSSDVGQSILHKQGNVVSEAFAEVGLYHEIVVYPQIRQVAEKMIVDFEKSREDDGDGDSVPAEDLP